MTSAVFDVRLVAPDVIVVAGDLDLATGPVLRGVINSVAPGTLTIDAANLDFIDAAGIGEIARATATHSVALIHIQDRLKRVLEIVDLDLTVDDDSDDERINRRWHESSWPQAGFTDDDDADIAPVEFDGAYDWPDWYY